MHAASRSVADDRESSDADDFESEPDHDLLCHIHTAGAIDESEFFSSEVEVANCNNGPMGWWNKWVKEVIPHDRDGNVDSKQLQLETLMGVTVAVAQIPEAPMPSRSFAWGRWLLLMESTSNCVGFLFKLFPSRRRWLSRCWLTSPP